MTNSPQIPAIPQDVTEKICAYRLAVATVGAINTLEKATPERKLQCYKDEDTTHQALLTAIASHLRPVVPVDDAAVEKVLNKVRAHNDGIYILESRPHPEIVKDLLTMFGAYHPTTQPNKSSALPDCCGQFKVSP